MIRSVGIFFGFYEVKSGQMGMIILPPGGSASFAGILWDVYLALMLNNFFAAQWEVLQFGSRDDRCVVANGKKYDVWQEREDGRTERAESAVGGGGEAKCPIGLVHQPSSTLHYVQQTLATMHILYMTKLALTLFPLVYRQNVHSIVVSISQFRIFLILRMIFLGCNQRQ